MVRIKVFIDLCLISLIQSCSLQIDESDMGTSDRKKTGHREITTHVSIHTIHLDGLRELYRHFLRLPDGAVVEVSILHIWLECLDMDPWHWWIDMNGGVVFGALIKAMR